MSPQLLGNSQKFSVLPARSTWAVRETKDEKCGLSEIQMAEMSGASEKSHLARQVCPKQLDWQEVNFKITMINKSNEKRGKDKMGT